MMSLLTVFLRPFLILSLGVLSSLVLPESDGPCATERRSAGRPKRAEFAFRTEYTSSRQQASAATGMKGWTERGGGRKKEGREGWT